WPWWRPSSHGSARRTVTSSRRSRWRPRTRTSASPRPSSMGCAAGSRTRWLLWPGPWTAATAWRARATIPISRPCAPIHDLPNSCEDAWPGARRQVMGTADRNWSARAGVGVVVLLAAFAACGPDVSPTEPGSPPAEAKVARASLPDPSADLGIWLEQSKPTKQWPNQHTGDCIVTDMWPKLGTAQLGGTPTSLQWTIYDLCPDE